MPRLILGGSHTWYMVARRQVVEGESGESCRVGPRVPTWGMERGRFPGFPKSRGRLPGFPKNAGQITWFSENGGADYLTSCFAKDQNTWFLKMEGQNTWLARIGGPEYLVNQK